MNNADKYIHAIKNCFDEELLYIITKLSSRLMELIPNEHILLLNEKGHLYVEEDIHDVAVEQLTELTKENVQEFLLNKILVTLEEHGICPRDDRNMYESVYTALCEILEDAEIKPPKNTKKVDVQQSLLERFEGLSNTKQLENFKLHARAIAKDHLQEGEFETGDIIEAMKEIIYNELEKQLPPL